MNKQLSTEAVINTARHIYEEYNKIYRNGYQYSIEQYLDAFWGGTHPEEFIYHFGDLLVWVKNHFYEDANGIHYAPNLWPAPVGAPRAKKWISSRRNTIEFEVNK